MNGKKSSSAKRDHSESEMARSGRAVEFFFFFLSGRVGSSSSDSSPTNRARFLPCASILNAGLAVDDPALTSCCEPLRSFDTFFASGSSSLLSFSELATACFASRRGFFPLSPFLTFAAAAAGEEILLLLAAVSGTLREPPANMPPVGLRKSAKDLIPVGLLIAPVVAGFGGAAAAAALLLPLDLRPFPAS